MQGFRCCPLEMEISPPCSKHWFTQTICSFSVPFLHTLVLCGVLPLVNGDTSTYVSADENHVPKKRNCDITNQVKTKQPI